MRGRPPSPTRRPRISATALEVDWSLGCFGGLVLCWLALVLGGGILGRFWWVMAGSGVYFGVSGRLPETSRGVLWVSWGVPRSPGATRGRLGAPGVRLGSVLGALGCVLGASGCVLGASLGVPWGVWERLGAILGASWADAGCLGASWGGPEASWDLLGRGLCGNLPKFWKSYKILNTNLQNISDLRGVQGLPETSRRRPGASRGRLGPSWGRLGLSWGRLGASWDVLWASCAVLWAS